MPDFENLAYLGAAILMKFQIQSTNFQVMSLNESYLGKGFSHKNDNRLFIPIPWNL